MIITPIDRVVLDRYAQKYEEHLTECQKIQKQIDFLLENDIPSEVIFLQISKKELYQNAISLYKSFLDSISMQEQTTKELLVDFISYINEKSESKISGDVVESYFEDNRK